MMVSKKHKAQRVERKAQESGGGNGYWKLLARRSLGVVEGIGGLSNLHFKTIAFIVFVVFSLLFTLFSFTSLRAEPDCENPSFGEIDVCLQRIENEIGALKPAHEYNIKELAGLRAQVDSLNKRIAGISFQLTNLESSINEREEELAYTQSIFEEKTSNHYKYLRLYDPLLPFLSSDDASSALRMFVLRQRVADDDVKTMEKYGYDLVQLRSDKESLEKNKLNLASLKTQVNSRADFLAGEVKKTETHLATLSARQEQLIAQKSAGFATSIGDTPPTMEPCTGPPGTSSFCDPGFRPAFAAFSFGAPHRTGMSQYGAYGRSKEGQSAEAILAAYYQGSELRKDYPVPDTIGVTGHGRIAFEDNYLLGIYEVPESWGNSGGFEALKAQAVAARSYALAVTNNGAGDICPTESCQVYKPQLKSGKWAEAVRATRGWVLTRGGSVATTYYASTSGGFTITNWGWTGIKDAKDGDWPGQAYEKISGSPWFYKAWYRTRAGAACGKSGPWLNSTEMADILNAWHVLYRGGGDASRISPIDTNCWSGNPYSMAELAGIGGYTSVGGVSVVYSNNGTTQSVTFSTNKGSVSILGEEFRRAFNLRAPGYIGLKSSLFNIEKL
jgi:peptidoglycan hydrolase CwlO-like protein